LTACEELIKLNIKNIRTKQSFKSLKILSCFKNSSFKQIILRPIDKINEPEPVMDLYGEGSFIIAGAEKNKEDIYFNYYNTDSRYNKPDRMF